MHATKHRLRECGQALHGITGVQCVDVLANDAALNDPILEITLAKYDRVPPRVLRTLTDHDTGVYAISRHPDHIRVTAI